MVQHINAQQINQGLIYEAVPYESSLAPKMGR